ncbi:DUF4910 domain-containing protein [Stratiformator vulcanicus]|uniref:DUF4910 domain-containing protein n=1 Tax=Stratiformator vulcanicus TaxID=2527980 RepID=UPI0035C68C1E
MAPLSEEIDLNSDQETEESDGEELHRLCETLYPICRSQTGHGVRRTLAQLQNLIPLDIHEVPTGTEVFDWVVPQEWNIRDASIRDQDGNRLIDFKDSNLHVVNGSVPCRETVTWNELKSHLHTLPEYPNWIPYRTAFHKHDWGFCLTQRQYNELERRGGEQAYEVCIDASIKDGSLTFGECFLPGESEEEVFISTHVCHPSLANDNLSGIAVATFLAKELSQRKRRFSYRFVFVPATIGAITWLALNDRQTDKIRHGLVLALLGDAGALNYRRSRSGDAEIDRVAAAVLRRDQHARLHDFEPYGYDQRQYCSPGFNLPMGTLTRTLDGQFPEYHTSADNLGFIKPESLANSLETCLSICSALERNQVYRSLNPKCEPRLGHHGLYESFGSGTDSKQLQRAVQWVLNFSDGTHSVVDIAERADFDFELIATAAERLEQCGLIEAVDDRSQLGMDNA